MDTDDRASVAVANPLLTMMHAVWGPLTWPLIIANVVGHLWCAYQAVAYWLA